MNSEAINPSSQSITSFLNSLSSISTAPSAKALDDVLKDRYSNIQFLGLLKTIIMSPQIAELQKEAMIKLKSSAAVMLNRCFIMQTESNQSVLTLEQSVQFFHQVLFSMEITITIKRMLQPSFLSLLKREEIQLADFFQEAFQKLVRLVQLYDSKKGQQQNQETTLVQQITFRKGTTFEIVFHPSSLRDNYELIVFLANTFISLFAQKTAVYQQKILETWKIVHTLIFREQTIQIYQDIILRVLVLWDNYIFDGIDLNRKLMPSYRIIYDWHEFSKDLIFLMNYKALKVDQGSNIYNYFFICEDYEGPALMQLKQKAIDIYSTCLKILQAVQISVGLSYKSSFHLNFQQIEKSLLFSINYAAKHKNLAFEQSIQINVLNLFSIWVQLKGDQINEPMRIQFLLQVVIPLIDFEIKLYQDIFGPEDRGEELILELNDCCQSQKQFTKLSNACKILQELVEGSNQLYSFLKEYALQSIISSKIENYQLQTSFDLSTLQRLSVPTAFLLLSITNYKERNQQNGSQFGILAQLINQTYFPMFANYEKQYFFFFCGFAHIQIFQQNKGSLEYLMQVALSSQYGSNVKRFAFDFLVNICDNYYFQAFTAQFLEGFFTTNFESKWSIVSKMLRKYLARIDESILCRFVQSLFDDILAQALTVGEREQQRQREGQSIKCRVAVLNLSTCRQISHCFDEISSKPALQNLLLNSIQYLRQVASLDFDDELIGICADIIEYAQILPDNFTQVIEQVKQLYFNNEYRGRCYHSFYSSCLEVLNNTTKQREPIAQIQAIYDILIQALGYLCHYPENLMDDHFEDIASHLFLLQKLYMLYGDKLDKKYQLQTLQICKGLISKLAQAYQPLILSRLMNMILLCKITIDQAQKIFPIYDIFNAARNNNYLFAYDSSFLIYLLTQIIPVLTPQQRSISVVTVITICDSWSKYFHDRNVRVKHRFMRQNAILSLVLPSANLQSNPIEQMKKYIQQLRQFNPEWFQSMKSNLTQNEITKLSAFYGEKSTFMHQNIQSFDYEDGSSQSYQSNEATLNDLNPNRFYDSSRRIIKVARGLQANPGRIVDVPTAVKRNFKDESCIDQQQPIRSHGNKKLKIQSAIVHQISKRDIVNEKIAKRSQRP